MSECRGGVCRPRGAPGVPAALTAATGLGTGLATYGLEAMYLPSVSLSGDTVTFAPMASAPLPTSTPTPMPGSVALSDAASPTARPVASPAVAIGAGATDDLLEVLGLAPPTIGTFVAKPVGPYMLPLGQPQYLDYLSAHSTGSSYPSAKACNTGNCPSCFGNRVSQFDTRPFSANPLKYVGAVMWRPTASSYALRCPTCITGCGLPTNAF